MTVHIHRPAAYSHRVIRFGCVQLGSVNLFHICIMIYDVICLCKIVCKTYNIMCTKRQQRRRCDTRQLSSAGRVSEFVSRHRMPQPRETGKRAQWLL